MTTPARSHRDRSARGPPRDGRPDDRARPTSPSRSASTARASRRSTTGIGFYDHLLGSLAHHGLFDLAIQRRRRPPGRRAPHGRGRRARARRGVRRGARRSSRDRPVRRRDGPDGRGARHARSSTSAAGRTRSIDLPFRGERVGGAAAPARRARARIVRADGRRHAPPLAAPAATTTTSPRPRSRRSAARLRAACELDPRADGVASTKGVARVSARSARGIAVVDYGAGNLVSIDQALTTRRRRRSRSRATPRRSRARTRSSCRASARRRRRWPGSTRHGLSEPIRDWLAAGPAVPRDLPRPPAPVRGQRRGRRGDARRPRRAARSGSSDAPTLPHIGWNQVERVARAPAVRRHRRRRRLLLRPLVRRRSRAATPTTLVARDDRPRRAVRRRGRARRPARRPVPPRTERRGRAAAAGQLRRPASRAPP